MSFDAEAYVRANQLREELAAIRRVKDLREAHGLNFYRPHEKQHRFHISTATGRYCRTGNRGGKTKCGGAEDVAYAIGGRLWYRESFPIYNGKREVVAYHEGHRDHPYVTLGIPQRPVKLLLIVVDWDKSTEIFTNNKGDYSTWGELFQLIPKELIHHINTSRGGHIDRIDIRRPEEFGGGISSIYIDTVQSYKMNKLSAESSDWDAIHLDEPCPQKMFTAHKRGLVDRNGRFWINCTPLDEPWINNEFTPPTKGRPEIAPEGLSFSKLEDGGGSRFMITWSLQDNPYNSKEAIAEFMSGLNREEIECRIHGIPLAMAGLVYKEFEYDRHVLEKCPADWKDFHLPPDNYTIRLWWDFHTRLPQAVLFFATDPHGTVYVYDELFTDNLIDPVATAIVNKTAGRFVVNTEIDPFACIPNPVDGSTIVDGLMDYGLYFQPATKDKRRGINKVRERLLERDPYGKPTIFFSPRLKETLFEFNNYVYDLDKNEPKDENDHMMENLYRAILSGLEYIQPTTEADYEFRRATVIGRSEYTKPLPKSRAI